MASPRERNRSGRRAVLSVAASIGEAAAQEVLVKVNIYVSRQGPFRRRPGIALVLDPLRIPESETWTYLRSGDTKEFDLPEAIEEEIERRGIWAQRIENPEILQKS